MIYPSIDVLLKKVDSKYTLVSIAAKRARQMREQNKFLLEKPVSHKFVGIALEELHAGKIDFERK
ncbi:MULTISPECIES: DNA-directed RNA polymerase subunit omega [Aneurinibacillus]|jgi:DNA-directed RNA polymerase subunit omega|uniref:DNA-directed RNA polymerase subunit omega n=1 Tax=Aneurinibacillus thermoaerophilus TaxID=143495 RepID=A0A1G7WAL2_ANETH|nr:MULTISPECIES: DNA-directed RNA polymerase subunit omega [Aneurinibacillus]AMA72607.1 DNA-directed RNA polymerase subunit omega [Aneurinibacillus sp. XH2]MED0674683.1 DNA-directed RNA polymerase subunit omega [Aneurinibacillus thermoaerophilus]MED0680166.1 DNA-directed RNA polymerase subunit omega [Aneurinibacillus thermoaerophilus]MED0736885.1 DNA-directed RNA polymerase subunit omega [Aneurinibacillus thermoaerophilus]MED0756726.1 DNA-directed RNA polymerase subunit omega [Aneurinibacillus